MIKVKNHLKFAMFKYENGNSVNYQLGDVVKKITENEMNDIGVIIQIHDDIEFRTDMFGNSSIEEVIPASIEDIELYRPDLLKHIVIPQKIKTNVLRTPYYHLSDSIIDMDTSINDLNDPHLKKYIQELKKINSIIYSHLQTNYIWD